MKGPLDNAKLLMEHAEEDLIAGEAILATGAALRAACFHAQQATEKSLKALLALDDVEYPLTHNLEVLLRLMVPQHGALEEWGDEIVSLTPYAVEGRYTGLQRPDSERVTKALETARKVHEYVAGVVTRAETVEEDDTPCEGE